MSASSLIRSSKQSINDQNALAKIGYAHKEIICNKPIVKNFFLPSQTKWINDDSPFVIGVKGRRTGITFAESYRAFRDAAKGVSNSYYTSYNYHACKAFIAKVAKWAKAFNIGYQHITDQVLIDANSISVFKVVFPNGYFVEALPGNPQNLRDKEGTILIDEAAIRPEAMFEEILDAANAVNVWGYQIKIWSTQNGESHPFNKLAKKIETDPRLGSYHFIPFKNAIAEGLYKKVCQFRNIEWSQEKEDNYVALLYDRCESSSQEYDAIPKRYSNYQTFREEYFVERDYEDHEIENVQKIRYFDLAYSVKQTAFFSATVLIAIVDNVLVIVEAEAERLNPADGDTWMENLARTDDTATTILIEQEPGSSMKYISYMQDRLSFRHVEPYSPPKDKMSRALPLIPDLKVRKIVIRRGMHNKEKFVKAVCDFDGTPRPLTNDWVDCLSGIHDYTLTHVANWIAD